MIIQLGSAVPRGFTCFGMMSSGISGMMLPSWLRVLLLRIYLQSCGTLDKCGVPTLKHLLSCVGLPAPTPKDWVISILHHCASSLLRFFSGQETYIALLQEHQRSPVPSSDLCMLLSQTLASYSFCTDSNVLAEVDFVAQTGHSSLLPLQDVFLFLRLLLVTSKSDIVARIPSGHASVH